MRFVKFIIAVLLLPTLFFTLAETGQALYRVLGNWTTAAVFFIGAGLYAAIHYLLYDFSRPYVFVHEMTHAMAALLCGSRISDISIGAESGYVKMDKANTFVVLAPYFVPGYVLLTVLVYVAADLFIDCAPYRNIFLFAIGFFMAFHLIQTFEALYTTEQPDLKLAGGKVFSVVMIVLANLVVLAVVLKGLFPEAVSLQEAGRHIVRGSINVWRIIVNYIVEWISYARQYIRK